MLSRNELIEFAVPERRVLRILWIDPGRTEAYVFDVYARSGDAQRVSLASLDEALDAGEARRLEADPLAVLVNQELLPPKHLALRARAWAIIQELAGMEPAIYESRKRGALIAECMARHRVSHPTIYRYLRRYWQRGLTPNALLPDYANSGARGKTRASSEGVKRGRPRKNGENPGVNVDDAMRRIFRVASASYAPALERPTRRGMYEAMIRDFFSPRSIDPQTRRVWREAPGEAVPTFGQFSYWLDQDGYPRQLSSPAPLPAHAAVPRPGMPGAVFQLEVVRADVQLVSRADRRLVAGRPALYVVSDIFSGLVAGVYVSLEPAGWPQALMAVANCAADKVRFCRDLGLGIGTREWPCRQLPVILLAESSLAAGAQTEVLLNNFGVRCQFGAPGRGAWRETVEQRFALRDAAWEADPAAPCGPLDGAIDLAQFTLAFIDSIIDYNLRQRDGQAPVQLWDWGLRQRGSLLRQYPEDLVRCCLLPVLDAVVTAEGICLHGSYYSCAYAVQQRWFERARQRGCWTVRVACDSSNMDTIYLLDASAPQHFHACHIADAGSGRLRLSAVERIGA
jgi:hypothetical protein